MPHDIDPRFGRSNSRSQPREDLDTEIARTVGSSPTPLDVRGIQRLLAEAGIVRSTTTIRCSIDRLTPSGVIEQIDVRSDDNHRRHGWRCPSNDKS